MVTNIKNLFISFSHKDDIWMQKIVKFLKDSGFNVYLYNTETIRIKDSDKWSENIEFIINKTELAILLVSPNYLASDFILNIELQVLEKLYNLNKIQILPIILKPCLFEDNKFISKFQVFPYDKTFSEVSNKKVNSLFKEILENIQNTGFNIKEKESLNKENEHKIFQLPPRRQDFFPRKDEINKVLEIIKNSKDTFELQVIGQGGIGKTELLKEVCFILKDKGYFKDRIYWIDFAQLDLSFIQNSLISSFKYYKDTLIVFDNSDILDFSIFRKICNYFISKSNIIIGSRKSFDFIHNSLELQPFSYSESHQFLRFYISKDFNKKDLNIINNLFKKAKYIPLYLRIIIENIRNNGIEYTTENIEIITGKNELNFTTYDKDANIQNTIIGLDNDHINAKDDYLNISDDIDAFAKLISYKELKPPLSIALFGNWGSGKSTFMEMLENRIETYTNLNHKDFCKSKSVVHVKFNAWHYSDTNLWASLVSHIFKELDKHINGKDKENRVSIYAKLLDSQREKIEEKESQQTKIEKEIDRLKRNIEDIENKKLDKTKEIKEINLKDISKEVLQDEDIKKELEDIKKEFVFTHGDDISEIKKTYDELYTTYSTYKKAIWLLYHNKKSRWYLGISIVVFIILSGLSYIYTDDIKSYISSLVAIVISGKVFLDTYIKKFSPLTSTIEKFIKNYEDKEVLLKDNEKIELEKEIAHKNLEIKEIKQQIQIEKDKKVEIEKEIEKIKSGEYLANFIADRSSSDDYTQHLGLVSVIREDFDKLKEQIELLEKDAKFNIERIVLYIDDLDRCADDKVVKVLEAIHLLLAFELFVVVVGVDSRWITNSLVKECGLSQKENDKPTDKATPYDYLEKIFQIPFKIKPLSKSNKTNLINELLKSEIKEDSEEIQESEKIENNKEDEVNISDQQNSEPNLPKNTPQSTEPSPEDEPPIPPKTDEDKNKIEDNYEKMKFSKKEIEFMEELVEYVGETPRTIKRYINIYRIIKNHQEIKSVSDNEDEYKLILVILCLVFTDIEYLVDESKGSKSKLSSDILNIYRNYEDKEKRKQYIEFILRFSFKD